MDVYKMKGFESYEEEMENEILLTCLEQWGYNQNGMEILRFRRINHNIEQANDVFMLFEMK